MNILNLRYNFFRLLKLQRRIYVANIALHYYVTQQWTFKNDHFLALRAKIRDEEKKSFYYEMETIDMPQYFINACIGGKNFILHEKMEDLPKAKAHFKRYGLSIRTTFISITHFSLAVSGS